jgi:hypothetical protein
LIIGRATKWINIPIMAGNALATAEYAAVPNDNMEAIEAIIEESAESKAVRTAR